MAHFGQAEDCKVYVWDMISGLTDVEIGEPIEIDNQHTRSVTTEHEVILAYISNKSYSLKNKTIKEYKEKGITAELYILLDFSHLISAPRIQRRLKTLSNANTIMTSIFVGPEIDDCLTQEMKKIIPCLNAPSPGEEELKMALSGMVEDCKKYLPNIVDEVAKHEKEIIKSARDKTISEAYRIWSKNIVTYSSLLRKE